MNNQEFDHLLSEIRNEPVSDAIVAQAADRVRAQVLKTPASNVTVMPVRLASCSDFQALIPAYVNLKSSLSEERVMLLEDHFHSCVDCRHALMVSRDGESEKPSQRVVTMKPRFTPTVKWTMAIAAALTIGIVTGVTSGKIAPTGTRATIASINGSMYRLTGGEAVLVATGQDLNERDEVRTAKGSTAVLRLNDGSLVEVNERAELSVSRGWRGSTIHLNRGNIIVQAAKQRGSFLGMPVRLAVATADNLVTVKGTIFAVSRGLKGTRVSVVEGEVKVDGDNATQLLHRGDQSASSPNLDKPGVAADVAWSRDQAKYVSLLGEFARIEKKLAALPGPTMRYEARLAQYLPEETALYVAIPNLGSTLAQATRMFEDRVQESQVLREWWNESQSKQLRLAVDRVRALSEFLGDEVVIAAPSGATGIREPMILAEVRKPGLQSFIDQQMGMAKLAGQQGLPNVRISGNLVTVSGSAQIPAARIGNFAQSAFGKRIAEAYANGANWLFAADLEQILSHSTRNLDAQRGPANRIAQMTGIDNGKYLVVERHDVGGTTENRATLSFNGDRKGMVSWLAAPAPMGSLEFVSPAATFATSVVIKNPGAAFNDIIAQLTGEDAVKVQQVLAEFRTKTGVDLQADIANSLGGELTIALDGSLVPPAWKVVCEVYNQSRLEWSIEQMIAALNRESQGKVAVQLTKEQSGAQTYYTLSTPQLPTQAVYTFVDGYLVAGPSKENLSLTLQNRATGNTLTHSQAFRAQLPKSGPSNFSAIAYQNFAPALGAVVDQLKSTGILTPEQQEAASGLTANRGPSLIYAYGETDRIIVASSGSFFGMNLDALLTGKAMPMMIGNAFRLPNLAAKTKAAAEKQ